MHTYYLKEMKQESLKVERLQQDVRLPEYAEPGSNGMDLFIPEATTFEPGIRKLVPMRIKVHFPCGIWGMLAPKSGLASKYGFDVMAGVIDSSYRGEIHALIINHGKEPITINKGEKLLQMILMPSVWSEIIEGPVDTNTTRGEGGFGSTGK
jgi:dUTP pyrophosphatase